MNLQKYIDDIRARLDDDPTGIDGFHSDAQLRVFINNARRKINNELSFYENQQFIFPELNIDEYALETDYISYGSVIDCRVNGYEIYPISKPLAEMQKNLYFNSSTFYQNLGYINERRRVLTLSNLPTSSDVEPTFSIQSFSRSAKILIVDGVSTGSLGDIAKWSSVKPYIKAITSTGSIEYMRVSKIDTATVATGSTVTIAEGTPVIVTITSHGLITGNAVNFTTTGTLPGALTPSTTYYVIKLTNNTFKLATTFANAIAGTAIDNATAGSGTHTLNYSSFYNLYLSSFDLKGTYKNTIQLTGTVSIDHSPDSAIVTGNDTKFTFECSTGDRITIGNYTYTVLTVDSDTQMTMSANVSETLTAVTATIDTRPIFADNDTIKFATYVFNYIGVPKDLVMYNENDQIPLEGQELVAILAAVEAGMRESRPDVVNTNMNEYKVELERIRTKINIDGARQYNKAIQREVY